MKTAYINNNIIIQSDCFNLEQTLDCGQAFRFCCGKDGVWRGVVGKRLLQMSQQNDTVTIYDVSKDFFEQTLVHYFTLDFDYDTLKIQLSSDETMKKAINVAGGIRLLRQDCWETLCSFIFSQNNNIPRIKKIIESFCREFGDRIETPVGEYYSFPDVNTISRLSLEQLEPIHAGFRAKYIVDAAAKVSSGEISLEAISQMTLDEARIELQKIKGVGPKVADCVLLFGYSKFDAFPEDVWIKRVMQLLYPQGLPEYARQYCGIAQQYLFHYARSIGLK